ncbi:hypothetical protein FOZ63_012153 [Perkinsus olseni]|uniref:Uncharacterized protein n=1 Tax=Perkinsus olseni TaxID=32597 RepID=A0A7J6U924_PEROL|nr:hypothetical protein FOZ63_012153 [Perkinsus olseni]
MSSTTRPTSARIRLGLFYLFVAAALAITAVLCDFTHDHTNSICSPSSPVDCRFRYIVIGVTAAQILSLSCLVHFLYADRPSLFLVVALCVCVALEALASGPLFVVHSIVAKTQYYAPPILACGGTLIAVMGVLLVSQADELKAIGFHSNTEGDGIDGEVTRGTRQSPFWYCCPPGLSHSGSLGVPRSLGLQVLTEWVDELPRLADFNTEMANEGPSPLPLQLSVVPEAFGYNTELVGPTPRRCKSDADHDDLMTWIHRRSYNWMTLPETDPSGG